MAVTVIWPSLPKDTITGGLDICIVGRYYADSYRLNSATRLLCLSSDPASSSSFIPIPRVFDPSTTSAKASAPSPLSTFSPPSMPNCTSIPSFEHTRPNSIRHYPSLNKTPSCLCDLASLRTLVSLLALARTLRCYQDLKRTKSALA